MSYTYKGTKITGTSTSGKVFKNSGISKAQKGQTYFNKSTGHVYQCTDGGKAKDAKWKYLKTDIASKPSVAVSGLGAPVRVEGTRKMKATWKTPAAMVDAKKGDRATELDINWFLGIAGTDPKKVVKTSNEKLTESTINLNSLTIGNKKYERKDFYPFANKPVLNYVTVKITSRNAKGAGASAKATRNFYIPRKPTISDFAFDAETGEVSCTIDTDAGNDYYERYDTRYKMTVYYSDTKQTSTIYDTSTTETSKTIVFDDESYASRSYEDYAKVTVQAWARGYKGDSAVAEKVFYVAYPSQASIDDVQVSSKDSTGKCTIYVDTHSTNEHPVDRVKLEYLANCTYAEANLIPGDASWEQTDILDDATCKALAMSVSNLIPDRGKYTWIRLKTFHANETVLYRYSQYWRVTDLETPAATAADDKIKILSATAGADGKSAVVDLVWDDGEIPSTGTEISWDEEEDAWKSTKDPSDYNFTWSDGPRTIDGDTWGGSATITIKGLEEASKYFVKARRYSEGDETTYSEYSNSATVVTSEKPESVTATADRYVPKGSGLNVYWTFAGNGLQREWQIVDSNGTVLANGEGSLGSTQIPADRLIAFAEDGDIEFTVQVSTGSGFVVSESKKVTIIESPELSITGSSLVHAHEEAERDFSGEIVTFEPRDYEFVKSLKVPLEPVQGGTPWMSAQDTAPYMFRAVPTQTEDFGHESDTLVGGSVVWNQLLANGKGDSTTNWSAIRCTLASDGTAITATNTENGFTTAQKPFTKSPINHKYLVSFDAKVSNTAVRLAGSLSSQSINTNSFLSLYEFASADTWQHVDAIAIPTDDSVQALRIGTGDANGGRSFSFKNVQIIDLTAMFGSTIADYVYTLEQATEGSGIAWLKSYGFFTDSYYAYATSNIESVEATKHVTTGKNLLPMTVSRIKSENTSGGTWSGNVFTSSGCTYELLTEDGNNVTGIKVNGTSTANNVLWLGSFNYIAGASVKINSGVTTGSTDVFFRMSGSGKGVYTYQFNSYGTDKTISGTTNMELWGNIRVGNGKTLNNMIFKPSLVFSENTTDFEPYVAHEYTLDSDLVLRGLPKLDASNNLYYDGDTYASDGTVTRKYGIVDLGSLTWSYNNQVGHYYFTAQSTANPDFANVVKKSSTNNDTANIVCDKYIATTYNTIYANTQDKTIAISNGGWIGVMDTSYTDATTFKTAMSGVYLVYELATSTTETADAYTNPQIVDPNGTEEYVGSPIPVGHKTIYQRICPITGFSGCDVNVSGKNLYGGTYLDYWYLPLPQGTTIRASSESDTKIAYYRADKTQIDYWSLSSGNDHQKEFTLSADTTYFRFYSSNGGNCQITLANESWDYEPFGQTYSVSWQDDAGTVYGGTVDVVSGVLTVDRVMDNGTITWSKHNSYSHVFYSQSGIGQKQTGFGASNELKLVNDGTLNTFASETEYRLRIGDRIYINIPSCANTMELATWLTNNPLQIVYELATPTTYQLDPVQVALLIGEQNNIWNDVDITQLKLAEVTLDEDQLQTNDLMLSFKSNKICDIKLIVTSQGAVGQFPQGILRQTAGDTIHSNVYVPVWAESNGEFTTTVHLPLALDFWDKGSYTLRAVAIDRQTGLKSSEVGLEFAVAWSHQAPSIEPLETYTLSTDITVSDDKNYYEYDSETQVYTVVEPVGTENPHNEGWYEVTITNYVTLTPIDEIDDNGFHHQAVQINLTPPPNADADDVYDIYRMTGDGAQLIGQSFPQTYIATDEYAPFGEDLTNHYRIAVRTADGDVEFSDIEYVLEGEGIRLDWAEGFIEYPYSIGIGDSYKKDVDIRKHLDGSIGAYWNHGVERSGSLSTDAIKILQQDDIDLTRRLGRYTGPVFVRTREGTAFEADVQISNLSSKNIAVMSIAIDATEVDLTEEFMLPTPFNLDEGEQ